MQDWLDWLWHLFHRAKCACMGSVPRSGKWPALEREILAENPECAGCKQPSTVGHHVVTFSRDKSMELDKSNVVAVCKRCHQYACHLDFFQSFNPHCREDLFVWKAKIIARP